MIASALAPILSIAFLSTGVAGHAEAPLTPEQVRVYADLQAAAYHCAPAVAVYTAERQRSFAQRILGGSPDYSSLSANDLFDDNAVESSTQERLLSCHEVSETKIRNNTCVLAPVVTQGPYYSQNGHPIRTHIAEYEPGLLTLYNIGIIDVNTCEPVPNILIDIWHANTTGHYSTHPVPRPDLVHEVPPTSGPRKGMLSPYPRTQPDETFLRGAYPSDKNGVVSFTSVFPGYYSGRATHVHVKAHPEWTVHPNGTFTSGRLVHIGQFFFEDKLNMAVDKMWPYSTNPLANKRGRTRNWDDGLGIFEDSHVGGYRSTFETYFLGGVLQQGIVAYITMAVNMTATVEDYWSL